MRDQAVEQVLISHFLLLGDVLAGRVTGGGLQNELSLLALGLSNSTVVLVPSVCSPKGN